MGRPLLPSPPPTSHPPQPTSLRQQSLSQLCSFESHPAPPLTHSLPYNYALPRLPSRPMSPWGRPQKPPKSPLRKGSTAAQDSSETRQTSGQTKLQLHTSRTVLWKIRVFFIFFLVNNHYHLSLFSFIFPFYFPIQFSFLFFSFMLNNSPIYAMAVN